ISRREKSWQTPCLDRKTSASGVATVVACESNVKSAWICAVAIDERLEQRPARRERCLRVAQQVAAARQSCRVVHVLERLERQPRPIAGGVPRRRLRRLGRRRQ